MTHTPYAVAVPDAEIAALRERLRQRPLAA